VVRSLFYLTTGVALLAAAPLSAQQRFVTAPEGNEARYRVREQLLGVDFPSDAVSKTNAIQGAVVFDAKGALVKGESKFTIDLTSMKSDSDRRDNYVRRNLFVSDSFPRADFVITEVRGLKLPVANTGEVAFELVGDLTVRGVTKPTTWTVTARQDGDAIAGTAATRFKFADFGMTIPRVRSVLSVEDDIKLEYDFRFIHAH
jgi:polyisoprenoid-binding protein YceI